MNYIQMEVEETTRTRKGYLAVWVGGGSYRNTFTGRFIIKDTGDLPPAIFVRERGELACTWRQALVPLMKGDIVVEARGFLPVEKENPDIDLYVGIFTGETRMGENGIEYAILSPYEGELEIPTSVREGLSTYHNRCGEYFVKEGGK